MATNSFIATSSPLDRQRLGKYEVLCRLSTGGMSAIFLAHQTGLAGFKKLVVLKTILPDIEGEEDFVGMFLEEARITAAFNHPNIAQVFELDTDDGQLFIAMEFVQGCTLVEMARACRQAKEPIPLGFTLTSTRDTALALHYAHTFTDARGRRQIVIHRDVAEKNIMVTYEGVTKLLDFGIAKALGRSGRTSVGMVKGTSGYMSPEQIRGEPLDPRSDVFALGVVMHECLTGLRLFHGKTAEEGMMAALREDVQPPSRWNKEVSAELDAVVLKALQRDREKRFTTALEFARAIEKAAPGLLWHPEQLGELVARHFSDRRGETRRLLESSESGAETTGEVRVQSVLAKVRASGPAGQAPQELRAAPEAGRKPSVVSAPRVPPPRDAESTRPGVLPAPPASSPRRGATGQAEELTRPERPSAGVVLSAPRVSMPNEGDALTRPSATPDLRLPEPITAPSAVAAPPVSPAEGPSPDRPRASRTPAPQSTTAPAAAPLHRSFEEDEDDASDKTIPAASLPDEVKNFRAQFLAARKKSITTDPVPQSVIDSALAKLEEPTPASGSLIAPPAPKPRTESGETVSITNQAQASDWDDDEGAKTAVALPGELPGQAIARLREAQTKPAAAAEPAAPRSAPEPGPGPTASLSDLPVGVSAPSLQPTSVTVNDRPPPVGPSGALARLLPSPVGLLVALVVLAVLALLGTLVLLDVIPLPHPS